MAMKLGYGAWAGGDLKEECFTETETRVIGKVQMNHFRRLLYIHTETQSCGSSLLQAVTERWLLSQHSTHTQNWPTLHWHPLSPS